VSASLSSDHPSGPVRPVSGQRHVYLVDDDEIVRNTLSVGLVEKGFAVSAFADGTSVLEQWASRTPDVAIVDLGLPDMAGNDLIERLLAIAHRPIIVLSRHHDSTMVAQAIERGVSGYLVKPISAVQLIPPIETAIARSERLDRIVSSQLGGPGGNSSAQLDALLEQFSFGVAIIDEDLQVVRRNNTLTALVQQGDTLGLENNRLHARDDVDVPPFRRLLTSIVSADEDVTGQVLAIGRSSPGRHLQVWGAPLACSSNDTGVTRVGVVVVSDPDQHATVPGSVLKSLYGLTATESRLAEALVNALSVEQFATGSKTSYNTARSHLKSIFVKTRTNRQVDLVRLLARMISNLKQ